MPPDPADPAQATDPADTAGGPTASDAGRPDPGRPATVSPDTYGRAAPATGSPTAAPPPLLPDAALERSAVVANSTMNRERGLSGVNSYARELGFDPATHLSAAARRAVRPAAPSWLDLCSGEGRALRAAATRLPGAVLTGVDLVGPLVPAPAPAGVELVTASLADWSPDRSYDLITCVHGLHYVGDQLGLLARAASWLAPDGLLAAHLDPGSLRWADGAPAGRVAVAALRAAGFRYSARLHLVSLRGARSPQLPFRYLGADPAAGPNWTGQPAVASYYLRRTADRPAHGRSGGALRTATAAVGAEDVAQLP